MTIHIATDHAGFAHKEAVATWLSKEGYVVIDHGANTLDPQDDFPDYISLAASAVSVDSEAKGVIFGGSGQGEAMVANRYPRVRATVFYGGDPAIVRLSRQHNDANILSIGARFVELNVAKQVIWEWLQDTPVLEEKYLRRNQKIEDITKTIHT